MVFGKWHPPAVQACDEQFYAIYYTTEFKFIGRGDAFIAPTDGTYTFKLWGSPGGNSSNYSAGYVEVNLSMKRGDKIYCFVGSGGVGHFETIASGGYNGGSYAIQCSAAISANDTYHVGTGGGATHISKVYNPIISEIVRRESGDYRIPNSPVSKAYLVKCGSWPQLDKVIAVAGGSGGYASKSLGYAGGNIAFGCGQNRTDCYAVHNRYNYYPANNNTGFGYARGYGMWCCGGSSGGGGWYSGFSRSIYTTFNACGCYGGGGTSYIRPGIKGFMLSGNDPLNNPGQPYEKPRTEGTNGYIKVAKQ